MGFFKRRKNRAERRTSPAGRMDVSPQNAPYVILDTELTGLDRKKDAIVSVGAVKMVGGRIDMGQTFYQLVNPSSEMKKETVIIHEITPTEVQEKPTIDQVLSRFRAFCGDDVLVGHYVSLDLFFINRELKRATGATFGGAALDTLVLADWLRWETSNNGSDAFNPKNYQLYEIAMELGVPVGGAHNALMDAFMTAQVLQRLLPRLHRRGIDTLERLLEAGNPSRKLRHPGMVI